MQGKEEQIDVTTTRERQSSATTDIYRGRDPRQLPAYDTFRAAHYLRIPVKTIENWAFGYRYPTRSGQQKWTAPLIDVADPKRGFLSFDNLVELHVLGALRREHNVEMHRIRRAVEYLKKTLRSPRPLLEKDMETDGTDVFVKELDTLINASQHGQIGFQAVLEARLKRIERNRDGVPIRLFPFTRPTDNVQHLLHAPKLIVIDPAVAFGRPVIAKSRVPTVEVFERFKVGETPDEIAEDFGRTQEEILEAIRIEAQAA